MPTSKFIRAESLSKSFGRLKALQEINLTLPNGGFLLLAGSNGAGKSTFLRLLAGLTKPTAGQVYIGGVEPHKNAQIRTSLGLLSQHTLLYNDLTASQNLLFFCRLHCLDHATDRVAQALDEAKLNTHQNQKVRFFSRGMRQRLSLARALLHDPTVLLMDEPFTGLDREATRHLRQRLAQLKKQGRTTILITHRMDEVTPLIDHLALLNQGQLCYYGSWENPDPSALTAHCDQYIGSVI